MTEIIQEESLKKELNNLRESAIVATNKLLLYYQVATEIPPHTKKKIDAILSAINLESATKLMQRAHDSAFMYCMGKWAEGEARGPRTKQWLLKEARKEDAFADRMHAKGFKLAEQKHRDLAKTLWEELNSITIK